MNAPRQAPVVHTGSAIDSLVHETAVLALEHLLAAETGRETRAEVGRLAALEAGSEKPLVRAEVGRLATAETGSEKRADMGRACRGLACSDILNLLRNTGLACQAEWPAAERRKALVVNDRSS